MLCDHQRQSVNQYDYVKVLRVISKFPPQETRVLVGIPMEIFALERRDDDSIERAFTCCGPFYGDQYVDCIVSNGKMTDELKKIWNETNLA
jgi:hypothetical protein